MLEANHQQIHRLNFLLRLAFFASGIASVLIGQILPILAKRLEINDRQAGNFFIFQFGGSLCGTVGSTWFARRNNYFLATVIGCFLMGGGVLVLNAGSFALCLAGFFLNGLGIGLTIPSINMLTLELNRTGSSSVLNILNFFWGVGAILSQPFVDIFAHGTNIIFPTTILAAILFATAVMLRLSPSKIERDFIAGNKENEDFREPPIWTNPLAWMIALFNFIHVGFEGGMGGWLKTYTQRLEHETINLFPPILLYFLFFVVGRGIAPVFLRFLEDNKILLFNLILILIGTIILLFAASLWFLSLGAAIAGLGTSSIFPTNISRFTKTFGETSRRRATPLFLCGTLGAAFTTWLIGFTSNYFGDLRSGMFVLLTGSVSLLGLQILLMFQKRRREALSITYS